MYSSTLSFFSCLVSFVSLCAPLSFSLDASKLPDIAISGFATVATAQTISNDKKEGTMNGMSNTPEYTYFNKLGLRLESDVSDQLGFTVQMVTNGDDDYAPKVDWAFVDYHFNPQMTLSAGKLRMPLYMFSEFKDVSYAYQWIIPPYAVYGSPDFTSFDGLKYEYTIDFWSDWTTRFDLWMGRLKNHVNVGGIGGHRVDFNIESLYGGSINVDRDWLMFRAVYMEGRSSSDIAPLIVGQIYTNPSPESALLREDLMENGLLFSIPLTTESDAVTLVDDRTQFAAFGTRLDFEKVFFDAEVTLIKTDPNIIVGRAISYYVLAGIRPIEDWSFSVTFSRDFNRPHEDAKADYQKDFDQVEMDVIDRWDEDYRYHELGAVKPGSELATEGRDPPTPDEIAQFYAISELLVIERYATLDTKTYNLGARWDFHPMASAKAEYLYKSIQEIGVDRSPQAVRLAIDLVF